MGNETRAAAYRGSTSSGVPDPAGTAHELGQRRDLDPPRREPQDAEGGILLAAGPERDRVVADGRRDGGEEVPEARLVGGVVGPLGATVDVDLLEVAGRVAGRHVLVRGEVAGLQRLAAGED